MKKNLKVISIIFGLFLTVFALLPYFVYGLINIGVWFPAILGVFFIALPFINPVARKLLKKAYLPVKIFFWSVFCVGAAYMLVMMAIVARGSYVATFANPDAVIVMGGGIEGDRPQLLLQYRLNAAVEFLNVHPGITCIVSGGEDSNSDRTEADVMKQYLVEKGIAASRVLMEDKSTDSHENLNLSAEILKINGFGNKVVIITDRFHQYRSALYAKHAGLDSTPYCSGSPYLLQQSFWIREAFAMLKYYLITGSGN
ncbi:MAG TPA: ElyC/SanA/YdcF family protein [Oscillospiraceae bacterium]|nr:ElyC/SanA/YdcF family protein [Oscillospiraceae bacterium]HPS33910.1 ElyC/SanA/YdcF family protein [Oscillospiraceae bacterium]